VTGWLVAGDLPGARGSYADLGFNTYGWRIMVCVFGSLCVPLMYLLALLLWRIRWFALAAATMVCFDGLFFVESRIAVIDIFPSFFIMLAYVCFLVHLGSRGQKSALATLLLTGVVVGLGISAKWIALAAWASILLFLIVRPLMRHVGVTVGRGKRAWSWRLGGPGLQRSPRKVGD
jgi:dolichyl-phosphate-mannose-protein mannosyltransferase